jgi:hypothetical protein
MVGEAQNEKKNFMVGEAQNENKRNSHGRGAQKKLSW